MSDTFPSPEAADPQDVILALETGEALWSNGKTFEALRWLRRAADSAEQAGNDLRAVFLAKTAAELTSIAERAAPAPEGEASAPADGAPAPEPTASRGPPPLPASALEPAPPKPAPLAAEPPPASVRVPAPPAPAAPVSIAPVPVVTPAASVAPAPRAPAPVDSPAAPTPAARSIAPAAVQAALVTEVPEAAVHATAASVVPSPPPRPAKKGSPIKVRGETVEVDVRQAQRVAVKRSVRDDSLYVVRKLDDGQSAGLGSIEALLILLERE